jgi:hypothetical protein
VTRKIFLKNRDKIYTSPIVCRNHQSIIYF